MKPVTAEDRRSELHMIVDLWVTKLDLWVAIQKRLGTPGVEVTIQV
jgi:hypothetical protein